MLTSMLIHDVDRIEVEKPGKLSLCDTFVRRFVFHVGKTKHELTLFASNAEKLKMEEK